MTTTFYGIKLTDDNCHSSLTNTKNFISLPQLPRSLTYFLLTFTLDFVNISFRRLSYMVRLLEMMIMRMHHSYINNDDDIAGWYPLTYFPLKCKFITLIKLYRFHNTRRMFASYIPGVSCMIDETDINVQVKSSYLHWKVCSLVWWITIKTSICICIY